MNHLLLAGASADQESGDAPIAGAWHGVFSYYLSAVARHYNGQLTYRDLIGTVNVNLRRRGYAQIPQLEGPDAAKARQAFA